jgi:hypothetical protein
MDLLAGVVVPLISIAVGAGVTYWLNVRTRRSMQFEDLINAAIAAVAVEEASRSAITLVVADQLDPADRADLQVAVTKAAIENHNVKNMQAREAIARVMTIDRGVRNYYLDPDAVSERSEEIIDHLSRLRDSRQRRRPRRRPSRPT